MADKTLVGILKKARKNFETNGEFTVNIVDTLKTNRKVAKEFEKSENAWDRALKAKGFAFSLHDALALTKFRSVKNVVDIILKTNDTNEYALSNLADTIENAEIKNFYVFEDCIKGLSVNPSTKVDEFVDSVYNQLFNLSLNKYGLTTSKTLEEFSQGVFKGEMNVTSIIAEFKKQYIDNQNKNNQEETKMAKKTKKVKEMTMERVRKIATDSYNMNANLSDVELAKALIVEYEKAVVEFRKEGEIKMVEKFEKDIQDITKLLPEEVAEETKEEPAEENTETEVVDADEFLYGDDDEEEPAEEEIVEQSTKTVEEEAQEETVNKPEEAVKETKPEIVEEAKADVENAATTTEEVVANKEEVEEEKTEMKDKELLDYLSKLTTTELKNTLKKRKVKGYSKMKKEQLVNAVYEETMKFRAEKETKEAERFNRARIKFAELGITFTDECYAKLSIEQLIELYNIISKPAEQPVVTNDIPLKTENKDNTTEATKTDDTTTAETKEQTAAKTEEKATEKPVVKEEPKTKMKRATKTTEVAKENKATETVAAEATIENIWNAKTATAVMKRIVGMAQKNYCINFISDYMTTSAIHEVLFGRPTKDYKTGEVSVFTAEEELTKQFKERFVEEYLIPNAKGTGYTIKSIVMAWNYKDVLYRYKNKNKEGKDIVVDYIVNYKDKTITRKGSDKVTELNKEAYATLDKTCMFINVVKKDAPKGASNASKGNDNKTVTERVSYKERVDALVAESKAKVEEALKTDDAATKETLANELKAVASKSDRIVEKELLALVKELIGEVAA